jgi:hypothetical protein
MAQQIACPKCGAGHQIANPGITMLVCTSCHAVVHWGSGEIQAGAESILPPSQSRLFLFASGKLDGVGYQVIGHLRYDYGRGNWDEWYVQTDEGREVWLSEDERVVTEELPVDASGAPPYEQLQLGTPVTLGEHVYTVRELATATCVGGNGQLPFSIFPGESYRYADLATEDGTGFATLEYQDDGVEAYAGRVVGDDRLTIEGEPPPLTTRQQGESINCTNCGASVEIPGGRKVATKVCEYCGTQLDMTSAEHAVLGQNAQGYAQFFEFAVGAPCTFGGDRYEVAGRTVFRDPEGYESLEYLLFNPAKGYLWLSEYDGHYHLLSESHAQPKPFSGYPKASTEVAGKHYRYYESGNATIRHVDGALPWKAYVGQTHHSTTLIAPPLIYEIETEGDEQEYFSGRYVSNDEICEAFGVERVRQPNGIGAAQPFRRSWVMKWMMVAGAVAAGINLILYMWARSHTPEVVQDIAVTPHLRLGEVYSEPFELDAKGLLEVRADDEYGSPWSRVAVNFVPADTAAVQTAINRARGKGLEQEVVNSRPGSELGSRSVWQLTTQLRAPPPGKYRVHVLATVGRAFNPGAVKQSSPVATKELEEITRNLGKLTAKNRAIRVRISQNIVHGSPFIWGVLLCLFLPLFGGIRRWRFEGRRWSQVLED